MVHGGVVQRWFMDAREMGRDMAKIEMGWACIVWCIVLCIEKKEGVLIDRREYNLYQFYNQYNTWRESI